LCTTQVVQADKVGVRAAFNAVEFLDLCREP